MITSTRKASHPVNKDSSPVCVCGPPTKSFLGRGEAARVDSRLPRGPLTLTKVDRPEPKVRAGLKTVRSMSVAVKAMSRLQS
jgi:hypothetical protein